MGGGGGEGDRVRGERLLCVLGQVFWPSFTRRREHVILSLILPKLRH